MATEISMNSLSKYWRLFGQIAVEMKFINAVQLSDALNIQCAEELYAQAPRVLATILFDKEWMSSEQIDQVLDTVLEKIRLNEVDTNETRNDPTSAEPPR